MSDGSEYDMAVHINWIGSILAKPIAENSENEDNNGNIYGSDPVKKMKQLDDGFRGRLSHTTIQHSIG